VLRALTEGPPCAGCGRTELSQALGPVLDLGIAVLSCSPDAPPLGTGVGLGSHRLARLRSASGAAQLSTTATALIGLTQRLLPPPPPRFPFGRVFAGGWVGTAVLLALLSLTRSSGADEAGGRPGFFAFALLIGLCFGWLVGLLGGALGALLRLPHDRRARVRWTRRWERLRSASYCSWDDVVSDRGQAYRPEEFVHVVFRF
jgi:hypothetical protein